jgi:predicted phage tail protein
LRRTVRLYGRLKQRFGAEYSFEAASPIECVRALILLVPGFAEELRHGGYKFVRGNRQTGLYLHEETLTLQLGGCKELHLIPARANAKGGFGKIIAGVALIGIAVATGGLSLGPTLGVALGAGMTAGLGGLVAGTALGLLAGGLGLMMVFGGVSSLLTQDEDE